MSPAGSAAPRTRAAGAPAWLFLAPMLVVLALVAGWPLARTIWFSFTDAAVGPRQRRFIGLENYLVEGDGAGTAAGRPRLVAAVWNTVYFAVVSVSLETVLGLIVALVLNAQFPAAAGARRGADPLGDPDHRLGQDVGLDAQRPVRHPQRPAHDARADRRAHRLDRVARTTRCGR
jgi:trehalose/maltose transport system permease protein